MKQATRARLTAHLELRRRQRVLVVTNSGQGTAQNVVITLDGIPYVQHAAALRNDPPVESIPPQMVASHDLKTDLTTPAPKRIRIDWRNE
ncbi:MAG TPA: hypothetical protein VGE52_01490, partial [Pirellulales bacterium]